MPFFFFFFFRQYRPGKCLLRYFRAKTPFQAKKTRSLKSRKIDIFPKTLTHGFGPKWPFFQLFFQPIQARKMSFAIFQSEKTPFYAIKTRSSKSQKIDIFLKGLTHAFGPNMAIIPTFFFQAIEARKMSFTIFQKEKTPFQRIKTKNSKSRKTDIFSKRVNPWFWSKRGHFPNFFFQAIWARKMSFTIFQSEETPFLAIKTKSSKSRKIDISPNGLTQRFAPKMVIFPTFIFRQYRPRKCLLRYSKRKNAFLRYTKKKFKKSKN